MNTKNNKNNRFKQAIFKPVIFKGAFLLFWCVKNKKAIRPKNKQALTTKEVDYLKQIGERLRYFRKKAGYTSYEYFAYENGFNRPQYGKYESGGNIQLNTLYKILKALDVKAEDFFKGID